jgi:hypothetical protein
MQRLTSRMRRPVRRQGAELYLLVTLLSFAASVTLTRAFLALTGYPQLGGGDLHIAHALWGGLLLYIAALLPLVFANRWVYTVGAALTGVGVGLFIDEVGKFITQANDYFYPLAAPIVYAFFLLTVMLYQRVRRRGRRDVRAELFQALDALEEVLEQDLDERERDELTARLRYVAEHAQGRPDLEQLANDLQEFLRREAVALAPRRMGLVERAQERWERLEARWVTRMRAKMALAGGLLGVGLVTLARTTVGAFVASALVATRAPSGDWLTATLGGVRELMRAANLTVAGGVFWLTNLMLETMVGLVLVFSAGLLLAGRDHLGTAFGSLGLLLSLTAVNLLVFYYDQFATIVSALLQLVFLVGLAYYRSRFLQARPPGERRRAARKEERPAEPALSGVDDAQA